ncbi:unnamed protein product [Cyprideis torosa]|uniref:DNA2/NAM7 helicase-like C-terminal domain-containing protein n=1 Tax=Cyprideis torosa TaxID=163714 RepID=A0A7R8WEY0_9CRUS|nr:unnamed protein product [Cyprideis torosa]CAG0890044.1 unnamed protein product [Cyprideis torosa]
MGMTETLFSWLDSPQNTQRLTVQYRMNKAIMALANEVCYDGQLEAGSPEVEEGTMRLRIAVVEERREAWINRALSPAMEDSVLWISTEALKQKGFHVKESAGIVNRCEAAMVQTLLRELQKHGLPAREIGVMAPYRAQVNLLAQMVIHDSDLGQIEVNTVDQFQGQDKEVVIYSCVRSSAESTESDVEAKGILEDHRRLTVAITRAKHKLVIFGNPQ